ncbi:hypothetical protein [Roseobacter sp. N2S]|uniref:hypothetical protein n=1 Tax=Roseobacter sp. N2S TaxID=2663844 RepID=UPI002862AB8D|nr:hypothetical protein [Roseobacter sp. N2S]MDR6266594.1 hypothetical protein [Roseobacter sp. N2S]
MSELGDFYFTLTLSYFATHDYNDLNGLKVWSFEASVPFYLSTALTFSIRPKVAAAKGFEHIITRKWSECGTRNVWFRDMEGLTGKCSELLDSTRLAGFSNAAFQHLGTVSPCQFADRSLSDPCCKCGCALSHREMATQLSSPSVSKGK